MNSCLDAVMLLDIKFGKGVVVEGTSFADITKRRSIDDVSHGEALDGLVLGNSLRGRHTPNAVDVTPSVLVAPVISSFLFGQRMVRIKHSPRIARVVAR